MSFLEKLALFYVAANTVAHMWRIMFDTWTHNRDAHHHYDKQILRKNYECAEASRNLAQKERDLYRREWERQRIEIEALRKHALNNNYTTIGNGNGNDPNRTV